LAFRAGFRAHLLVARHSFASAFVSALTADAQA